MEAREIINETSAGAEHAAVGDKPTQEGEENLLQAAMLTISDLGFRLDETQAVSRFLAEENDKLATELSEAWASQTQLESRVRELEATLKEWGNGGEETWWEEEQSWDNLDDPPAEEEPEQDSDPAQAETDPEVACDGADGVQDTADAEDCEHGGTSTRPFACALQDLLGKATGESHAMFRAYEKLQLPALPEAGDTDSWLSAVKWACARAGEAFSDCLELAWVTERTSATFEQLSSTSWARQPMSSLYSVFPEGWRKLDLTLARTLGCMLEDSQDSRAKVIMTAIHEYAKLGLVVRGRHMV